MAVIQGSSRIKNISGASYITGPTGFAGNTGPRGLTGTTGQVGPVGFTGYGIAGVSGSSGEGITYELIFTLRGYEGSTTGLLLTQGTTLGVTGIRGSTGDIPTASYSIINALSRTNSNYGEVFKSIEGRTATFRNLTVSGSGISIVTPESDTILIRGLTHDYGILGNTGELIFINNSISGLSANAATNTFWSGDQLTARILTHRERFVITGSEGSTSNNFTSWSVTPGHVGTIGINTPDGTSVSFSSITDKENAGDDSTAGLTAMYSGIYVDDDDGSHNAGVYRFPGITFNTPLIPEPINVGSCCYCRAGTGEQDGITGPGYRGCLDYVSEQYCDEISGWFSGSTACINRSEGTDCHYEGMCCVNGNCIETTQHKCNVYAGFFIPINSDASLTTCDDLDVWGGCPEACGDRGACCLRGECITTTPYECSLSMDSIWLGGETPRYEQCDDVNCCLQEVGACCVDEVCYNCNAEVCASLRSSFGSGDSKGMFWGAGSKCSGLNYADPPPTDNSGNETVVDQTYAPYNCLVWDATAGAFEMHGLLKSDGMCQSDDTPPPCTGCPGWSQVMPTMPDSECPYPVGPFSGDFCLCPGSNCYCAPENTNQNSYTCLDYQNCGTIILQDGSCHECCKSKPGEVEEQKSACCKPDHSGDGTYECVMETWEDCTSAYGIWTRGESCVNIDCNWGACCKDWGCEPGVGITECYVEGGIWIANGNCGADPCSEYSLMGDLWNFSGGEGARARGQSRSQDSADLYFQSMASSDSTWQQDKIIGNSGKNRKTYSVPEYRKVVDAPDAKQFSGKFSLSGCIEPRNVVSPVDKGEQWTIEVGSGDCNCCCPGVCWEGALGDGGIVNDCKDIDERCYNNFDSEMCVGSSSVSHKIESLPTKNKSICAKETWKENSLGCQPYIDDKDSTNQVWMVCSSCCDSGCIEFDEPVPCSDCESRGNCVCVNGCDKCFA